MCESCEKRLKAKVCVPDKWKDGAQNTNDVRGLGGSDLSNGSIAKSSSASGGKVGRTNKALERLKASETWVPKKTICRICKSKTQVNMNFCNDCAHKKGICTMCGKKVVDTSMHKMTVK